MKRPLKKMRYLMDIIVSSSVKEILSQKISSKPTIPSGKLKNYFL